MKTLAVILMSSLGLLIAPVNAGGTRMVTVKQAVYLAESDSAAGIQIIDVPCVAASSDPEWRFSAIAQPFVPFGIGQWNAPHDVNLASLYRIKVSGVQTGTTEVQATVDASQAVVPDGYPFTLAQAVDAVTTCVKLMYPARPESEGKFTLTVIPPPSATVKEPAK